MALNYRKLLKRSLMSAGIGCNKTSEDRFRGQIPSGNAFVPFRLELNRTVFNSCGSANKAGDELRKTIFPGSNIAKNFESGFEYCEKLSFHILSPIPPTHHLGLRLAPPRTATSGGLDLGSDGVWDRDYGWGVRVRRPFGARGRSSVRSLSHASLPSQSVGVWGVPFGPGKRSFSFITPCLWQSL